MTFIKRSDEYWERRVEKQLQTERQNIMDEIARRNDLADIPKQAEEMALRFEKLGGNKADLAQIVNDARAEETDS